MQGTGGHGSGTTPRLNILQIFLWKWENYEKAFEYKNEWIRLNDVIFNSEKNQMIQELQTRYETEKKDQEIESLNKDNQIQNWN